MRIVTSFEDDILKQYERRGASAFFTIFLEQDGRAYPSATWMDFGSVIIGWWIMATVRLLNAESPQELYFMDGPFSLRIELESDRRTLTCSNVKEGLCWTIGLGDWIAEILKAANAVRRRLLKAGVDEKGRESLQAGIILLSNASA